MKANLRSNFSLWLAAAVVALLACGPARAAAQSPAVVANSNTSAAATATVPKSQFDDASATGRDPFYPRYRPPVATASSPTNATASVPSFVLGGILRSASKRLAVINNHTFEAGEDAEVPTADGKVKIHVDEIYDDRVLISVGSQQIELVMKEKYRLR